MKGIHAFLLSFFLIFFTGCSTFRLMSSLETPGFSLSKYSSYNYYMVQIDTIDVPEFYERIKWIAEEIDNNFEARGISRSKTDPDLLVNVGLAFVDKTQTRETDFLTDAPFYMGTRNYAWEVEDVAIGEYKEGTFVMHLVEADSSALLYEGVMQGVVLENDKKTQKNIIMAVKELFNSIK